MVSHDTPLQFCRAVHPEHADICCSREAGHQQAHSAWDIHGSYTWGMQHFEVVSQLRHAGSLYLMLDDGQAECVYVADRAGRLNGGADWRFELSGLHVGRTLDLWLCNVCLEFDDDGPWSRGTWSAMRWADDGTALDDASALDGYGDALVPLVTEMLQEGG